MISLIAAMDRNRNIGFQGDMPWGHSMKSDLKRFKELTTGNIVVMGRKTYDSIGKPLPNRTNIILTRDKFSIPASAFKQGCQVFTNIQDVLGLQNFMNDDVEIFIIGGAQVYEQFVPHADRIYLTRINTYLKGDTKFPEFTGSWKVIEEETHRPDENNKYGYTFITYEKGR